MKFNFEKLKNHKKYGVFYDLIKEMQKTKECSIFLNNSEVILTHIIGMFIENSADIQHDIERLNQQEKLSDKVLNGFRNVYDDITKAKSNKSLTNTTKDGIFNGLNIICNWLLFRESISYMVPIKNYGRGCAALKKLKGGGDINTNTTSNNKNANNKIIVEEKADPPVEEETKYDAELEWKIQEIFDMQDEALKPIESYYYVYAYVSAWKERNHYHDYEYAKKLALYELYKEWKEIECNYDIEEDEDLGRDY